MVHYIVGMSLVEKCGTVAARYVANFDEFHFDAIVYLLQNVHVFDCAVNIISQRCFASVVLTCNPPFGGVGLNGHHSGFLEAIAHPRGTIGGYRVIIVQSLHRFISDV
jgi:hypothetical protein